MHFPLIVCQFFIIISIWLCQVIALNHIELFFSIIALFCCFYEHLIVSVKKRQRIATKKKRGETENGHHTDTLITKFQSSYKILHQTKGQFNSTKTIFNVFCSILLLASHSLFLLLLLTPYFQLILFNRDPNFHSLSLHFYYLLLLSGSTIKPYLGTANLNSFANRIVH